ncbi:unnamed protein product [Gadus morhua 'NCC']
MSKGIKEVQLTIEDDSLRANLKFTGEFLRHSRSQLVRRPVRAGEREVLAEALQTKLPRSLFLEELQGLAVIFSSPCSAVNVEKHFHNLQLRLQGIDPGIEEPKIEEEEFGCEVQSNR